MQSLQEEITADLNKLKQEIEFQVPDFLKQSIQQLKLSSYPMHKKLDIIKSLTGSRTCTEENFEGKLAESLLRHLLRIRKNRVQTIPGLNSQKPVYLGQLITLTLFVYEDQLLNEFSVLSDITKQINCKIQEFYEEHREQLKLIKVKEQNLLKFMQNSLQAPILQRNDDDSDFSKCLCHQANGLFQQIKGKLATSAIGTCRMCNKSFHGFCLQNNSFGINFICPYCTISNLDPLNKVQEELYKPQFTQLSLLRNEKTIFIEFPKRVQGCRIQIRCLRVDDKGGLDEITWPDYGELYVNQYKYQQFEPCLINSSLKKRRDEYYIINNQLHVDKSNKITLIEGKPTEEQRKTHRIKQEGVYMIGVFACNTYINRELVQEIKQNPRNFISIHEAMKNDTNDSEFYTRKVSLLCQVSMQLMKIPAKGRYCAHMQCFDLENYILMMSQQSSRGKWRCVICKLKCFNFLIDSYQQIILDTIHDHDLPIQDIEFENGQIKDPMLRELNKKKSEIQLNIIIMKRNYLKLGTETQDKQEDKKTFDDLKFKVFLTYFEILETKTLTENKGILLVVILNLQLIFMTANDKNLDLQNSFISSFLPISNYFLLYPVLLNSDSILFNILFQVIAFIVLSFLMVVIYYISQQSNFDNPIIKQLKSTWGFISELTDKILVVPVFGLTVGNLSCNFSSLQTQCYSTMNIILIVLSILCSIMLLFLEVLFSYLFFNFTFKIKDSISRNPSGMPIFFFLYRLGITIFQSLFDLNVKSTYTILVLLHLIFGLIMMYDSLNNFPYHNKNVSKAQGIFASAYLWINATFLLLQLTSIDMLHENVLVIMGLGMAFFLKLFLNIRNYFVKVLMNSELDEIQSAVLLDLKLRNYNTLAKTLDIKKSELLLASLLKIHSDKCTNVTCPCKKRSNLIDPKKKIVISDKQPSKDVRFKQSRQESTTQLHRDQVFVKHFIARMAKDGLNKFKDSKLLYLDYMYYRFEALRLYSSIYFEVSKFEGRYHNDMSLSIEFCLYRLRARLRKYLIGRNQKSEISRRLMLENVKAFDEGIIKQKANILDVNRNLIDLWESLSEEKPDLSKLLDIGNSAIRNMQVTSDQYEFLLLLNNQSQDLKNLMTIYSNYLAYDDLLAKKIEKDIEQSRDMENDNSFHQDFSLLIKKYQIFDKQSCVLSISPQSETLGQIVWCSRNVVNVFGYDESELLTMNINQLMPEPIAINHNKILKNFYDNGRELYTTKMTHVWGIDANKICFSANIFIKILAKLDTYDIVGFVHKLNQEDYIIADPDGMIYGVGKKVSEHIEMLPEYVIESKVNIQLLSPGINEIFKDYFTQFEGVGQSMIKGNDNKMSYDDFNNKNEMQKDQKYFFLISENQQQKIQSFIDTRASVFKKNNFDLITKEPINQENSQGANNYIKSIKQNFEFKKEYASLFYKVNSKILIKTLCRMVKVKVQVKNFTFWNGSKLQRLKIIKINSYETKDNAYIRTNRKKIKELGIKVTELYCKVKEAVNDFKQKKMKQKQQEEQENVDELEDKVRIGDQGEENPEGQQMKGFANLFKKGGRGGGRQSIFQKMNKMGGGKGKTEQNENQLRQGILMTLFKPNLGKKNAKYKRQSKNSGSVAQVYGENREDQEDDQFTRKKIEIPQEQLDQIKKCVAIPKIWQVLFKANIVGNSEWSVFYEKKKEFPEDELALKFKRIRDICKSKKFLEYKDKILDPVNESHSSNTDNIDYENNSIKDDDSQLEERSLIRNLQVNQGAGEEEKAAMQSVSSSTQSLQAHNAQRMLREQLKNMQAPTILIIAHYTMIFLCVMLFTLIISQYGIAVNDFNGIKSEIQMYERLSNYSDNLIELLDGYYSLQMINEGPFKDIPIYNATWQSQFREKIIQNEQLMVQFFLNDFSQAGAQSQSGNDLRSYLFVSMDAQLLVNGNAKLFSVNYENYVRLLLNAVNATINLDISQFSINSSQDYFYYIYHNLEEFNQITILNYNLITDFLISSKDSLINQFYAFWFSCFSILFLLYLLIYPIILKTKLKIQETLRIFTKISLADVEYYSTHYKMIFYEFKGSQDSPQVLKKIEDSALKTWEEKKRKDKENNTKNLARSRSHKGIQINKVVFFLVMTLWLLIFSGLLFVKDYFLIQFANKLNLLYESQETQHKLKFIYQMEYVNFKNAYFNNYIDQTNITRLEEQFTSIGDIQISKIFTDQYEQLEIYSSDLSYLVNQLSTNNTCYFIQNSLNDFPYASLEDCESLLQGILKQGLLNFYQQLKLEMMSGITQLQRTLNKTQMVNYISQQRFQDYNSAFYYAKLTNQLWSKSSRQGLYIGIDNEINFNQYFVIILSILLALFLILVWGREYMNLKRNSRWVNGFILLIPSQLRSENKHINSFLKNQLKIQGLMYL